MNTLCKPSLGASGHVPKMLQAENGQKVDEFEPIYLGTVITDIDEKWFVVFEHTLDRLSFGCVRLPQLENCFSCFAALFLLLLFFLLPLCTSQPLNALYSNFERLKISEGLICD